MKMKHEKSKILKIREIDFRLRLKELVVTKKVWGLEVKNLKRELTEI